MFIPNLKWQTILTRGSVERQIILTEQQQYILLLLASMLQQSVYPFIPDASDYDIADINQTIEECINSLLTEEIPSVSDWKYGRFFLFGATYDNNIGIVSYSATGGFLGGVTQLQNVQNTMISWDNVPFKKGTYSANMYCDTGSNFGISTMYVPAATSVCTFDTYSSTYVVGVKINSGSFTVADDGYHTVQIKTLTKNASSSGYLIRLRGIEFIRTGD